MSVSVLYASTITVTETLETNIDSMAMGAARQVVHAAFNESGTLNAASDPPATKVAEFVQALTDGAATVDLTALTGTNGASVDGSGLKVQLIRVKNLGDNTLTLTVGADNGYNLAGAGFSHALESGQIFEMHGNDATPDIAGADCEIDLAGTTTQTSEWTIVMG